MRTPASASFLFKVTSKWCWEISLRPPNEKAISKFLSRLRRLCASIRLWAKTLKEKPGGGGGGGGRGGERGGGGGDGEEMVVEEESRSRSVVWTK